MIYVLSEALSNWNLIRISGFLAYFLFTFSIAAGITGRISILQKNKQLVMELHQQSGWVGLLTVIFHFTLLLKDHYAPYTLKEIFIPFIAENEPFYSALGTISFYLLIITVATSDFLMKRLGKNLWKKIHFAVIPAWLLSLLHSVFMGTDSQQMWATYLYSGGLVLIVVLLIFRYLDSQVKQNKKKVSIQKAP